MGKKAEWPIHHPTCIFNLMKPGAAFWPDPKRNLAIQRKIFEANAFSTHISFSNPSLVHRISIYSEIIRLPGCSSVFVRGIRLRKCFKVTVGTGQIRGAHPNRLRIFGCFFTRRALVRIVCSLEHEHTVSPNFQQSKTQAQPSTTTT
jgi:hypothetical protein